MRYFNLNNNEEYFDSYSKYIKFSGLVLAKRHSLPVLDEGWVIFDDKNLDLSPLMPWRATPFLCRPDAKFGTGYLLPRGRDVFFDGIQEFASEIKSLDPDAILLVFKHPSVVITGHYIPRYHLHGGVMIVVDKLNFVDIEFVGYGFDVGDITRGKAAHTSFRVPLSFIFHKPAEIMRHLNCGVLGNRFDITSEAYLLSRQERIRELSYKLGESAGHHLDGSIPMHYRPPHLGLFSKCVFLVQDLLLDGTSEFDNPFGIMINLYKNYLFVFEIWRFRRSN